MSAGIWESTVGRDRLNDWYDHFLDKIDVSTESVFVDTRHGQSHVLIAGPEDASSDSLNRGKPQEAVVSNIDDMGRGVG